MFSRAGKYLAMNEWWLHVCVGAVTEWSGGLYISPSMAGSRAGALIAGAWAAMMSIGENGASVAIMKIWMNFFANSFCGDM